MTTLSAFVAREEWSLSGGSGREINEQGAGADPLVTRTMIRAPAATVSEKPAAGESRLSLYPPASLNETEPIPVDKVQAGLDARLRKVI